MAAGKKGDKQPAAVDPDKAAKELLKATAEAAKADAEAKTAEIAQKQAELELAEAKSPLGEAQREAEGRKAIDVANQEAADARQKQAAALIPDLSEIEGGELETAEGPVLFGPTLARGALTSAVAEIASASIAVLKGENEWSLLVTTDAELAASDAVYRDVLSGIAQMSNAMTPLLPKELDEPQRDETAAPDRLMALLPAGALAAGASALASALPGAVSLLLPRRTLSTAVLNVESIAAAAAAIGALRERDDSATIVHDGFRLLPENSRVLDKLAALEAKRQTLVGHRLTLEGEQGKATADASAAEEKIKELSKALEGASDESKEALEAELRNEKSALAAHRKIATDAATRIGLIKSAVDSVDSFLNALRSAPAGSRSPLATALLREQLHRKREGFTHVLLIDAKEGSSHQVLDDRRFRADQVSLVGAVNVSYMLIDVKTSNVLTAGLASGNATLSGKIGSKLKLDD